MMLVVEVCIFSIRCFAIRFERVISYEFLFSTIAVIVDIILFGKIFDFYFAAEGGVVV